MVQKIYLLQQRAGISGLLLYLWMLVPLLFPERRNLANYDSISLTAVLQLAIIGVGSLYCLHLLRSSKHLIVFLFKTPILWYVLYLIWSCLTALFSANILYSLVSILSATCCLMISLSLCLRFKYNFEGLIRWMCWWGITLALIIIFKNPDRNWLDIREWHDAAVFAIAPFTLLVFYNIKKYRYEFSFMILLVILSTSIKVYLGLLIAVPLSLLMSGQKYRFHVTAIGLLILIILYVVNINISEIYSTIYDIRGAHAIETGSGRFNVWPKLLQMGYESPVVGYGFAMAEKIAVNVIGMYMSSTHNAFLSAFLYSGVFGVILFLMFFVSLIKRFSLRLSDGNYYKWLLATIISILIFISFDQGIGNKIMISSLGQTLAISFTVYYSEVQQKQRNKKKESISI